jgi:hypothetical protein
MRGHYSRRRAYSRSLTGKSAPSLIAAGLGRHALLSMQAALSVRASQAKIKISRTNGFSLERRPARFVRRLRGRR